MKVRRFGSTLLLLLAGIIFSGIAVEIVLQIGAAYVRITEKRPEAHGGQGDFRVVCIGDSNTFGLGVEPSEAYPQQLEALANGPSGRGSVTVLNFGWPGLNSSQIRADLRRILEAVRPDLVLVLIGNNDFWTVAGSARDGGGGIARVRRTLERHSRLYKLYRIAVGADEDKGLLIHPGRAGSDPELTLHQDLGGERERELSAIARYGDEEFEFGFVREAGVNRGTRARAAAVVEQNLREIVAETAKHDTDLILMTYPSWQRNYGLANSIIRTVAAQTRSRLIDLTPEFERVCPDPTCTEYFQESRHPTPAGYSAVAARVMNAVPDLRME